MNTKTSDILDDAREKIAQSMFNKDYWLRTNPHMNRADKDWKQASDTARKYWLELASVAQALSGTTDIECPECRGHVGMFSGSYHCYLCGKPFRIPDEQAEWIAHQKDCEYNCPKCDAGVIKHKWKVSVTLENGELPKNPLTSHRERDHEAGFYSAHEAYDLAQEDMAEYVQEVRQVVE